MKKLILIGNLTKDADSKTVGADQKLTFFDIAINEKKKGVATVTYITCNMWRCHEALLGYLKKGAKVSIVGDLDVQKWKDKEGVEKQKVCCNVGEVQILSFVSKEVPQEPVAPKTKEDFTKNLNGKGEDDLPF